MYRCLLCGDEFPAEETLFDVMDTVIKGPACVHCFSRLTKIATSRAHHEKASRIFQRPSRALPYAMVETL